MAGTPSTDSGPTQATSFGVAGLPFTSADLSSGGSVVTDEPVAGTVLVLVDCIISSDTTLVLTLTEEVTGTLVEEFFLTAGIPVQVTTRGKRQLSGGGQGIFATSNLPGNISIDLGYYFESIQTPVVSAAISSFILNSSGGAISPVDICSGPDGNLWILYTEVHTHVIFLGGSVCKVSPAGVKLATYDLNAQPGGPSVSTPTAICVGSDGNLWITDNGDGGGAFPYVARITPSGVITYFSCSRVFSSFTDICAGPDNNLWVSDSAGLIWQINTSGVVILVQQPYLGPGLYNYNSICVGSDGLIYFAGTYSHLAVTSGELDSTTTAWTSGTTQSLAVGVNYPAALCSGPDGNLWMPGSPNVVWRSPVGGSDIDSTAFILAGSSVQVHDICSGPLNALWIAADNRICWMVTIGGIAAPIPFGRGLGGPPAICVGPDGALWLPDTDLAATLWRIVPR